MREIRRTTRTSRKLEINIEILRKMMRTNKFLNVEQSVSGTKKSTSTEKTFEFNKNSKPNNGHHYIK